ncbi:interleukin-2 receptor subunit beta-like [Ascaphus truei]|uniref:interleukin-2 receptor subunit beta-like n=1 Tax=Ascaphus truei TaxID=8439 RepID=UPI003F5A56E7
MSRRWQAQGYLLPLGVVLFLQSLVLAGFPGLDCTYNLWDRLSCSWDAGNQWTSSPCSVRAVVTDDEDNIMGLCSLPIGVSPRRCELYLNNSVKSMHAVTVSNSLHLTVTCSPEGDPNVTVTSCIPEWFPFYHLCLDPPQSLDIAPTPDGQWNLSWSCHHYLHMAGNREYEIQFKLSEEPWESLPMRQDQLWVPLRQLHPDTQYIAKVRVTQKRYRGGKWSDWSQPLQWRTPPAVSSLSGSHLLTQVLAPCIAVGIFLLLVALIIRSSDRIKKIFWVGVPDPSQFFDPLMSTHKGNFQKWLSSPFSRSSFSLDPTPLAISTMANTTAINLISMNVKGLNSVGKRRLALQEAIAEENGKYV